MRRGLSYADAVRMLGGQRSATVDTLDKLVGGALVGVATAGAAGVLSWLDAAGEVARLGHALVRSLPEQRLRRYNRSQRLEAAHTVLVTTAFFEVLDEARLPIDFRSLLPTKTEQLALVARDGLGSHQKDLVEALMRTAIVVPRPQQSRAAALTELLTYYAAVTLVLRLFAEGFAAWDELDDTAKSRFQEEVRSLPEAAVRRYAELFARLAGEFPELAWWAGVWEHEATRERVDDLRLSLSRVEAELAAISTGRAPQAHRADLALAYRKVLSQPIVETDETTLSLKFPTLGEAYLAPRYRTAEPTPETRISDETWWSQLPVQPNLDEFLLAHLTSVGAVQAPLLVLGQPGAGKSVLTKVLAARLPAQDFLPVRVVLRDVAASADVQDQIEHALRSTIGERVEWPALARAAGDALPVLLLDGFDELLQATGVSQSDYLTKVARFQQREADLDRPVAVIITSRISVADRARLADGAVAVKLEPFDEDLVTRWLTIWNEANAGAFTAAGVRPLASASVLAFPQLAEQPLLLLMLALYDADGNALTRLSSDLAEADLYERLLSAFARREVVKHRPSLSDRQISQAVDEELRRLSVVAFAMFNRAALWVLEPDLNRDLAAFFRDAGHASPDFRAPLPAGEKVLGRFFFVHRAQALRDDRILQTFEFLHATFGEYLIARLTVQALQDVAARSAATTVMLGGANVDDNILYTFLSYQALATRGPIVGFLRSMLGRLPEPQRDDLIDRISTLFRDVHATAREGVPGYAPQAMPIVARLAEYSVNLMTLAVCTAGLLPVSRLLGTTHLLAGRWHREALLWRSQLSHDEWLSVVDVFSLDRVWTAGERDIMLGLAAESFVEPAFDLYWTHDHPPVEHAAADSNRRRASEYTHAWGNHHPHGLRRQAYFIAGALEDLSQHALQPIIETMPDVLNTYLAWDADNSRSVAQILLDALLLPVREVDEQERRRVYLLCAEVAQKSLPPWADETQVQLAQLLLDRIRTDPAVTSGLLGEILPILWRSKILAVAGVAIRNSARCVAAVIGRDSAADHLLADHLLLDTVFGVLSPEEATDAMELWLRVYELYGRRIPISNDTAEAAFAQRPDLRRRFEATGLDIDDINPTRRTNGVDL